MSHEPETTGSRSAVEDGEPLTRASLQASWNEHRRWIAAVLLAYKPRSADLDDLLQEVAMTLVSRINTLRDQANLRAWLRTVAINAARAAARTQKNRPTVSLNGHAHSDQTIHPVTEPTAHVQSTDEQRRVMDAIAQLPDAYREPLMLKAVQGMRTRQIAHTLGIEEATVDTRVSRARRMLRDLLDGESISAHNRFSFEVEP